MITITTNFLQVQNMAEKYYEMSRVFIYQKKKTVTIVSCIPPINQNGPIFDINFNSQNLFERVY